MATDNRDAVVLDAAAAFADVLRSAGVPWQTVQRLQSMVVARTLDELQGELFPGVPTPEPSAP